MTGRLPARAFAHSIPGGLVLIGLSWTLSHTQAVPASAADFMRYLPWVVFGVGLLLSAIFHRARIFHSLLLLFSCNLALLLAADRLSAPAGDVLVRFIGLALPLNLVLIAFLPESGIFSRQGLLRLGVFAIEGAAVCDLGFVTTRSRSCTSSTGPSCSGCRSTTFPDYRIRCWLPLPWRCYCSCCHWYTGAFVPLTSDCSGR